ncbi:MAG TPA: DUF4249 family protein [Rubricoccaceae bacterium]
MRPLSPTFLSGLVLAAALAFSACDASGTDDAGTQTVVAAFLEAGEPFPEVRLSRTVLLGEVYDDAAAAINDAVVAVELLGPGGVEARTTYALDPDTLLGRYLPVDGSADVLPGRTYRLVVQARGQAVTAETTVPPLFEVVEPLPDEVVYQSVPSGPPLRITTSSTGGRQAVYVATAAALQPDEFAPFLEGGETRYRSRNLPGRFRPVSFFARVSGCDEEGASLVCDRDPTRVFTAGTSPIINESSYVLPGDGTAIVNVPWFSFGFYGPSEVSVIALDDAFQDFIETRTLQSGGGTISPGEIPNVTTNVTGALGVFGSFARVTVRTTILDEAAGPPAAGR